jgi:hypothetical protein
VRNAFSSGDAYALVASCAESVSGQIRGRSGVAVLAQLGTLSPGSLRGTVFWDASEGANSCVASGRTPVGRSKPIAAAAPTALTVSAADSSDPSAGTLSACDAADAADVVARAASGDEVAFARLYPDVQPRLLRYAASLVATDADDVTAEAWLHIVRDLPGFVGDVDAFRGWAARIVRNRAMDLLRSRARRPVQASPSRTSRR